MTRSYNYDDNPYVRQSRGLPYHTAQDRYLNSALYEGSRNSRRRNGLPPYEDPHSDLDLEDPKARKRIPVAVSLSVHFSARLAFSSLRTLFHGSLLYSVDVAASGRFVAAGRNMIQAVPTARMRGTQTVSSTE